MWLKYCPFSSKSTSSLLIFSAFIRLFQRLWDGAKRCMLARKTARGWGRGWERRNSFSPSFFCKKSQSSLFVRDNRKWMTFHLEYDNGKIWVVSWHLCTLYGLDLLIKFPVIFLGIWSGWKKCDRVSRLLSRSVCKRSMRAQTPQSQNVIFLLNVDNIFGPSRRVTYLWSYFVGLSLQPPPRLPTYPSPTPTAHPKKCYFY